MASGDTLAVFFPAMADIPASSYATFEVVANTLVLSYDDTTDEDVQFPGFMPRHYDGGGITVTVGWMTASATSGTISLDVALKSITDDTDDMGVGGKSFAAANNANPSPASASGEVKYTEITFTDGADMDSIAAGEYFRMLVRRDANGTTSTDNMTGDMQLVFIEIRET